MKKAVSERNEVVFFFTTFIYCQQFSYYCSSCDTGRTSPSGGVGNNTLIGTRKIQAKLHNIETATYEPDSYLSSRCTQNGSNPKVNERLRD